MWQNRTHLGEQVGTSRYLVLTPNGTSTAAEKNTPTTVVQVNYIDTLMHSNNMMIPSNAPPAPATVPDDGEAQMLVQQPLYPRGQTSSRSRSHEHTVRPSPSPATRQLRSVCGTAKRASPIAARSCIAGQDPGQTGISCGGPATSRHDPVPPRGRCPPRLSPPPPPPPTATTLRPHHPSHYTHQAPTPSRPPPHPPPPHNMKAPI